MSSEYLRYIEISLVSLFFILLVIILIKTKKRVRWIILLLIMFLFGYQQIQDIKFSYLPKEEQEKILKIRSNNDKIENCLFKAEQIVKNSLKNPDSYDKVKYTYNLDKQNYIIINLTYRGTNSFNAIVTERYSYNCLSKYDK